MLKTRNPYFDSLVSFAPIGRDAINAAVPGAVRGFKLYRRLSCRKVEKNLDPNSNNLYISSLLLKNTGSSISKIRKQRKTMGYLGKLLAEELSKKYEYAISINSIKCVFNESFIQNFKHKHILLEKYKKLNFFNLKGTKYSGYKLPSTDITSCHGLTGELRKFIDIQSMVQDYLDESGLDKDDTLKSFIASDKPILLVDDSMCTGTTAVFITRLLESLGISRSRIHSFALICERSRIINTSL